MTSTMASSKASSSSGPWSGLHRPPVTPPPAPALLAFSIKELPRLRAKASDLESEIKGLEESLKAKRAELLNVRSAIAKLDLEEDAALKDMADHFAKMESGDGDDQDAVGTASSASSEGERYDSEGDTHNMSRFEKRTFHRLLDQPAMADTAWQVVTDRAFRLMRRREKEEKKKKLAAQSKGKPLPPGLVPSSSRASQDQSQEHHEPKMSHKRNRPVLHPGRALGQPQV